jgi:hypothetical protein
VTVGQVCVVDGCGRPQSAKERCATHYARWRLGDPDWDRPIRKSVKQRIAEGWQMPPPTVQDVDLVGVALTEAARRALLIVADADAAGEFAVIGRGVGRVRDVWLVAGKSVQSLHRRGLVVIEWSDLGRQVTLTAAGRRAAEDARAPVVVAAYALPAAARRALRAAVAAHRLGERLWVAERAERATVSYLASRGLVVPSGSFVEVTELGLRTAEVLAAQ